MPLKLKWYDTGTLIVRSIKQNKKSRNGLDYP